MQASNPKKPLRKKQHRAKPGIEARMQPQPVFDDKQAKRSGKLKGRVAVVSFTRSLSASLLEKKIRVNASAQVPIWTPLIMSGFTPKEASEYGSDSPMKRAGQPVEIAPSYLFLACSDSAYMTGQVLQPNGGEIING